MKPDIPSQDDIRALPLCLTLTAPPAFEDHNGHMNIRHYLAVFDDAGDEMAASFGITKAYHRAHGTGGFDLEHHLHYLNEVMIGDTVSVYFRLLARTAKRVHYMLFMVNDTRGSIAALFECVNSFADMTTRRTAPFPPDIAASIDMVLARHQALGWPAPVCGVMRA
jgi:acyl-CoA thioester hydrolase